MAQYNVGKFCLDKSKELKEYQDLRRRLEANGGESRTIEQFHNGDKFFVVIEWWEDTPEVQKEKARKAKELAENDGLPPDGVSEIGGDSI